MGLDAMFSSISGLQSDSQWLDVIGNNIANVNTVAYKASRAEFANQLTQTLVDGSGGNPSNGQGGVDPEQVGLGTRLASIETIFTQGPALNTGISTDISIQGNGFLIAQQGNQSYLTRAGNLTFDSQGFLVNQNGERIQGYTALPQFNQKIINSQSSVPGKPAVIVDASLALTTTNVIGSIQIPQDLTLLPKATTEIDFGGNLDSLQQANQPGGILNLNPGGQPLLPIADVIDGLGPAVALDANRMITQPLAGGGYALQQIANLSTPQPGTQMSLPMVNGFESLGAAQADGAAGNYAWDQQPPVQPAQQISETVYDSTGNQREVSILFYQVNDLGPAGINNSSGPNQVCYAWYGFETTGGVAPSTKNLLGGTAIAEGNGSFATYDRGNPFRAYIGDFLWFNTDGSLASSGGSFGPNSNVVPGFDQMTVPRVYLPGANTNPPISPLPQNGAEIIAIDLNFGKWGLLGIGQRNGIYSDADGSYKIINGVNTYVPDSTVYAASQNGYPEGQLQSISFDPTGMIEGAFSNGQTVGLAQVALEQVQNPDGLSQVGNNDFALSLNSGPVQVGQAGQGNFGTIQDDSLEGSNVDLTTELSNMILAQRSFDTDSRMIAVVNETMDTLDHLGQ